MPVYFFMSFNNTFSDDLVFTTFFSNPDKKDYDPTYEAIVMFDKHNRFEGITKSILQFANLSDDYNL